MKTEEKEFTGAMWLIVFIGASITLISIVLNRQAFNGESEILNRLRDVAFISYILVIPIIQFGITSNLFKKMNRKTSIGLKIYAQVFIFPLVIFLIVAMLNEMFHLYPSIYLAIDQGRNMTKAEDEAFIEILKISGIIYLAINISALILRKILKNQLKNKEL